MWENVTDFVHEYCHNNLIYFQPKLLWIKLLQEHNIIYFTFFTILLFTFWQKCFQNVTSSKLREELVSQPKTGSVLVCVHLFSSDCIYNQVKLKMFTDAKQQEIKENTCFFNTIIKHHFKNCFNYLLWLNNLSVSKQSVSSVVSS